MTALLTRLAIRGRQVVCGLTGHDRYLHTDVGGRVTMRCVNCSHDTPGWQTGGRHYTTTQVGDAARHRLDENVVVDINKRRPKKVRNIR